MSDKSDNCEITDLTRYIKEICINVKDGIDRANKEIGRGCFDYPPNITIQTANGMVRVTVPFQHTQAPEPTGEEYVKQTIK